MNGVIELELPLYVVPPTNAPPDKLFKPVRRGISARAIELRNEVMTTLELYTAAKAPRTRKRKQVDQERFVKQLDALIAGALLTAWKTPQRWLSVSLNKAVLGKLTRYEPDFMTAKVSDLLHLLSNKELGWIEFQLGYKNPFNSNEDKQTTFRAAPRLLEMADVLSLCPDDYGYLQGTESIILRRAKEDFWDKGDNIEYEDTEQTQAMRQQMRVWNEWLAKANLGCLQDNLDVSDVLMCRIFNGDFRHGGRLYGGFWQGMSNHRRCKDILIDQRRVVALDFGQMGARLAYSKVGAIPPADAYSITGLEMYREGVKKLMSAMLNVNAPMKRLPQNSAKLLPKGATMKEMADLIFAAHAPIADLFHNGTGLALMRDESEILLGILFRLKDAGVVALPIHDAIVVREDKKELAQSIMLDEFKLRTGVEGAVSEEV